MVGKTLYKKTLEYIAAAFQETIFVWKPTKKLSENSKIYINIQDKEVDSVQIVYTCTG